MEAEIHQTSSEDIERITNDFIDRHGDSESGIIADSEYDLLFDHLASVLTDFGTFSESASKKADFNGYRYVDQMPFICNVPDSSVDPRVAVAAALKAIATAHRPLAVAFDYFPDDYFLILPGGKIYTPDPTRLRAP